jgi:hypothetical protein
MRTFLLNIVGIVLSTLAAFAFVSESTIAATLFVLIAIILAACLDFWRVVR